MAVTMHRKPESHDLPIADRTVQQLSHVFRLLADNSRLRILMLLARSGELHVSALCDLLSESQPAVSHHLTLLRMANLVGYRREGKFNFYYLDGLSLGETLDRVFKEAGQGPTVKFGDVALTYSRNGHSH
jgi:ArsR family transcriptional regulator, arsenate/arsenite/antimonite-responsive transcriptional repressor